MKQVRQGLNLAVAAVAAALALALPAPAQQRAAPADGAADVAALLDELAQASPGGARRIERQIARAWAQSGSAAADYLFQRGEAALQAGDPEAAIAHFSAVIDHAPDFAEAFAARARAYYMANRLGQALADLETVLRAEPRHFEALAGLGLILEQIERPEDARAAYAAALAVHPNYAQMREALTRLDLALAGLAL